VTTYESSLTCAIHRSIGDLLGEAKASGNLGNTLKVLGRFDEAVVCCQRHLDIARDLNDKVRQQLLKPTGGDVSGENRETSTFSPDVLLFYLCQVGQTRALYNFGNVYHAKGKSICWSGAEPGDFPEEVMMALRRAAEYYE